MINWQVLFNSMERTISNLFGSLRRYAYFIKGGIVFEKNMRFIKLRSATYVETYAFLYRSLTLVYS